MWRLIKISLVLMVLMSNIQALGCKADGQAISTQGVMEKIKKNKRIDVGYVNVPPWIMKDPKTNELSGLCVDAITEIAKQAGFSINYSEANWGTFISGLQTGQYDISIVPAFVNIPRAMSVVFTEPISYVGNSALIKNDDKRFMSVYDLDKDGVVVAVTQGEQGHDFARANLKNATLKIIPTQDPSRTFTEVLTGNADAALGDLWFMDQFIKNHKGVRDISSGHPYATLPASWCVRQNDLELANFLNASLVYLRRSGQLDGWGKQYNIQTTSK